MKKKKEAEGQQVIPELAEKRNEKIHRAAKNYDKARDEAANAREVKNDKEARLIEVCIAEGYPKGYRFGDVEVVLNSDPTVKCRVGEAAPSVEAEEDEPSPIEQ